MRVSRNLRSMRGISHSDVEKYPEVLRAEEGAFPAIPLLLFIFRLLTSCPGRFTTSDLRISTIYAKLNNRRSRPLVFTTRSHTRALRGFLVKNGDFLTSPNKWGDIRMSASGDKWTARPAFKPPMGRKAWPCIHSGPSPKVS